MRTFPLLQTTDRGFYPPSKNCPVCGKIFSHGIAYLSAGAILLSEDQQDSVCSDRLQAFFHVGFHGVDPDMQDSADVAVVVDLNGGQFDLQWCSVACMRQHLMDLLDELETQLKAVGKRTDGA